MYNQTILDSLKPNQYISLILYLIFIVMGFFMIAGNGLIVSTVLGNKQMRKKEMVLMAGLAIGDGLSGIGVLVGGVRRLHLMLSGTDQVLQTSWECLLKFPTIFYITGGQATALMMLLVSVDRFVAVRYFSRYLTLTSTYFKRMLGVFGSFTALTTLVAFVSCYLDPDSHVRKWPNICLSTWAIPRWYSISYTFFTAAGGLFSVIVYVGVWLAHRAQMAAVVPESNTQTIQRRRQRRMTVTIGIITVCTFFFHSIPYILIVLLVVAGMRNSLTAALNPFAWMLVDLNSIVNIFVLLVRHGGFRKGALAVVRCSTQVQAVTTRGLG